jgi:GNAT superfamily N-acetyltransferase
VTGVPTTEQTPERVIRLAVPADREPIVEFCRNTWGADGDYIEQVIDRWLAGADGTLAVAEFHGRAAACCYMRFMSPRESCLAGMRVDPAHRRSGLALALTRFCVEHAARHGRTITRLIVGWNNGPALGAVARAGFAHVGSITRSSRDVNPLLPQPAIELSASAQAPMPRPGTLWAVGWSVREIRPDDVEERASAGWALRHDGGLALLRPSEDHLWLSWLDGPAASRATLARAARQAAARAGFPRCLALLANDPLTEEALAAAGFERGLEYRVFEMRSA